MKLFFSFSALILTLSFHQAQASTYNISLRNKDSLPLQNFKVVLSEYKTTWYGGTTNKYHESKTNKNGEASISYKEDNHHYFDTVLCVVVNKKETVCKGIASIYNGAIMCFENLKKNKNCEKQVTKCDFELSSEGNTNFAKIQCQI